MRTVGHALALTVLLLASGACGNGATPPTPVQSGGADTGVGNGQGGARGGSVSTLDAGTSSSVCAYPSPTCVGCDNAPLAPECTDGVWACPPAGPCASPPDSGPPDVGIHEIEAGFEDVTVFEDSSFEPDSSIPGTVECGGVLCSTEAFYCQEAPIGDPSSFTCAFYPPQCASNPTCACLAQAIEGCVCQQMGGGLVLQCGAVTPPMTPDE